MITSINRFTEDVLNTKLPKSPFVIKACYNWDNDYNQYGSDVLKKWKEINSEKNENKNKN